MPSSLAARIVEAGRSAELTIDDWRIAIDVRSVLPEHSGIGVYAEAIAGALIQIAPHHRYLLFGVRGAPAVAEDGAPRVEYCWTAPVLQHRYLRSIWENVHLPRYLARSPIDIFHSTTSFVPMQTLRPATVVTIHDLSFFKYPAMHTTARRRKFRFAVRRSITQADALIAVSESTRRDILELFEIEEERVAVVHHGMDSRFSPVHNPVAAHRLSQRGIRPPFVLSVGTIEPRKNHVRLIRAFECVAPRFPALQLVLVGRRGWKDGEVFQAIRSSLVRERIRFLGYVQNDDLPELYRQASVLAYPSLYEGFGLPVLEALGSGTPVLTSDRSAMPEVVGESALLVDPTSIAHIAEGLTTLLTDSTLREQLQRSGMERARQFTWEAAAEATLSVYQNALHHRARRRQLGKISAV